MKLSESKNITTMKKLGIFGLIMLSVLTDIQLHAEENYASKVERRLVQGDIMYISFDITATGDAKSFTVVLVPVYKGQKIKVSEAFGNIGYRQMDGKNEIVWYYKKDFDGEIEKVEINVYACRENEPRALGTILSIGNNGFATSEVKFANNSRHANQCEWDFGDIASGVRKHSFEENPSHVYEKGGLYTVKLVARNTGRRHHRPRRCDYPWLPNRIDRWLGYHQGAKVHILSVFNNTETL